MGKQPTQAIQLTLGSFPVPETHQMSVNGHEHRGQSDLDLTSCLPLAIVRLRQFLQFYETQFPHVNLM